MRDQTPPPCVCSSDMKPLIRPLLNPSHPPDPQTNAWRRVVIFQSVQIRAQIFLTSTLHQNLPSIDHVMILCVT